MVMLKVDRLTKSYGRGRPAVHDLSLSVEPGEVYGLVGLNGAGKTTTLRMILGLIRPTAGTVTVLSGPPGAPAALARIGSLVEAPAFYPYLSGRRNLSLLGRYTGHGADDVERALGTVGLTAEADRKYRFYSLGMKQRLGVAAALLKDPALLILDEPTNGLDAAGVASTREMVREQRAAGRTILFSSHMLSEVENLCDRIGVIHEGRLIVEGTMDELRSAMAGDLRLIVRAEPMRRAQEILRGIPEIGEIQEDGETLTATAGAIDVAEINRALVLASVSVREFRPVSRSLEDVFMRLTHSEQPSADPAALGRPR